MDIRLTRDAAGVYQHGGLSVSLMETMTRESCRCFSTATERTSAFSSGEFRKRFYQGARQRERAALSLRLFCRQFARGRKVGARQSVNYVGLSWKLTRLRARLNLQNKQHGARQSETAANGNWLVRIISKSGKTSDTFESSVLSYESHERKIFNEYSAPIII